MTTYFATRGGVLDQRRCLSVRTAAAAPAASTEGA